MTSPKTTTSSHPSTSLTSPPNTDIWRKPPTHNVFTAPTYPSSLHIYPLSSFKSARVSFTLPALEGLKQYDQAGLVLKLTKDGVQEKWVKTGIEIYYGKPYLATVGCDTWADWSLCPLPTTTSTTPSSTTSVGPGATIEARRESDELGKSLWIYYIVQNEKGEEVEKRPLRELTWVFGEEDGWNVEVGAYCCRPSKEEGELEVGIGGLSVEVLEA